MQIKKNNRDKQKILFFEKIIFNVVILARSAQCHQIFSGGPVPGDLNRLGKFGHESLYIYILYLLVIITRKLFRYTSEN